MRRATSALALVLGVALGFTTQACEGDQAPRGVDSFALPDGSTISVVAGTHVVDCAGARALQDGAEITPASICVFTPWRFNQEAQHGYIVGLYQAGFADDGRVSDAIHFCKDGERLTLTAIPANGPGGDHRPPGEDLIFLFIPEPDTACAVER